MIFMPDTLFNSAFILVKLESKTKKFRMSRKTADAGRTFLHEVWNMERMLILVIKEYSDTFKHIMYQTLFQLGLYDSELLTVWERLSRAIWYKS